MKNNQYIRQAQYKKGFAKMWIILGLVIILVIGFVVVLRGCWIVGKFYFHSTCVAEPYIDDPIKLGIEIKVRTAVEKVLAEGKLANPNEVMPKGIKLLSVKVVENNITRF